MQTRLMLLALTGLCVLPCASQKLPPPQAPEHLVIGRHSFIDIGPPFDYYEIETVDMVPGGVRLERAQMSASPDACSLPASFAVKVTTLATGMKELLGGRNLCSIPEKELRRKRKDCNHCLVFSGANVTFQFECAGQAKLIRSDILDRDIFDSRPKTPAQVAWTLTLLNKLDANLGDNIMDRPIFSIPDSKAPESIVADALTTKIANGDFDALFGGGGDLPSQLFKRSQIKLKLSTVSIVEVTPVQPVSTVLPVYPPIARAAHVSGRIEATATVGLDGRASDVRMNKGSQLLASSVIHAIEQWRFPKGSSELFESVIFDFQMNCPPAKP